MKDNDTVGKLLTTLALSLHKKPREVGLVYNNIKAILEFLVVPLNNTDENCKRIDNFICLSVDNSDLSELPESLRGIIEDMGHALHDTHSNPEIAKTFQSTPNQLLERLYKIGNGGAGVPS